MPTMRLISMVRGAAILLLGAGALAMADAGCGTSVTYPCAFDCTGGTGGGGFGGAGGGFGGGGGTSGEGPDCNCACGAGGPAAQYCNDPAHPSFCAGVSPPAGGPCETSLEADCGFIDADIAALGCAP